MNKLSIIKKRLYDSPNFLEKDLVGCHCIKNPLKKNISEAFGLSGLYCCGFPLYENNHAKYCLRLWKDDLPETIRIAKEKYDSLNEVLSRLNEFNLDFFVKCKFVDKVLIIQNKDKQDETIPGLLIDWAGETLSSVLYPLDGKKPSKEQYKKMSEDFWEICRKMKKAGVIHGDISANNITVNQEGRLKLIDYDSLYIPSQGYTGPSDCCTGTAGFQHPTRIADRTPSDDNFSQLIIYVTLLAYSYDPKLNRGEGGRDVMLFSASELENIDNFRNSDGYNDIRNSGDPKLNFYLDELEKAFEVPYDQVPFLCDLIYELPEDEMPLVSYASYCGICGHHFENQTDLYCPDCGKKREFL